MAIGHVLEHQVQQPRILDEARIAIAGHALEPLMRGKVGGDLGQAAIEEIGADDAICPGRPAGGRGARRDPAHRLHLDQRGQQARADRGRAHRAPRPLDGEDQRLFGQQFGHLGQDGVAHADPVEEKRHAMHPVRRTADGAGDDPVRPARHRHGRDDRIGTAGRGTFGGAAGRLRRDMAQQHRSASARVDAVVCRSHDPSESFVPLSGQSHGILANRLAASQSQPVPPRQIGEELPRHAARAGAAGGLPLDRLGAQRLGVDRQPVGPAIAVDHRQELVLAAGMKA